MAKAVKRLPMPRALDVANEALSLFKRHEGVCEERHKAIAKALAETNAERKEMHKENQESVRRIYSLLWKVAVSVIVLLVGFLWQLLTKN